MKKHLNIERKRDGYDVEVRVIIMNNTSKNLCRSPVNCIIDLRGVQVSCAYNNLLYDFGVYVILVAMHPQIACIRTNVRDIVFRRIRCGFHYENG